MKTVLVTGASRGIGKAIALRFASSGYDTIITCHQNHDRLEETQSEIESFGVRCLTFTGDHGNDNDVNALFQRIKEYGMEPDILVNNAGISYVGLLQDMSTEEWNRVIATNLSSVFYCCRAVIPVMLQKGTGKIINISSVWGVCGASCEVAYSASKGGMNAFTMALAKELAPSNIQVNAVACGAIDTEMNQFLDAKERITLENEIPAGRLGKTEEAADFVWQLAHSGSYMTGQIIQFDGGWI